MLSIAIIKDEGGKAMAKCKRCGLFLFGVGVGAAVGIMLAPKSGREVRQELFGSSMDVMDEPGTETGFAGGEEAINDEDLKARIEETSARLKAEIEAQKEE